MSALQLIKPNNALTPNYSYFVVAAVVALGVHLALLNLSGISIDLTQYMKKSAAVNVTLLEPKKQKTENERQPIQDPPIRQEVIANQQKALTDRPTPDPLLQLDAIEENVAKSPRIKITTALFQQWSQDHKPKNPTLGESQQMQAFEHSFVEKTALPQAIIESHMNQYGEQHVVTKIGNKDVCYMQDNPLVKDEWSTNIVMFYQCDTKDQFTLGLR